VANRETIVSSQEIAKKAPLARGRIAANGAGVGLAMAEAIVSGAGRRLDLISLVRGHTHGFEAIVHLPSR
jgi:hypothetical protein